jgi:uncharacterized protein YkwD
MQQSEQAGSNKMFLTHKYRKTLFLIILSICLCLTSTSVFADGSAPGDPPGFPKRTIPSNDDPGIQGQFPALVAPYNAYLPLIQQNRSAFSVNIHNRQESLDFFLEQYLTSEGVAINWTGNRSSCDPGSTDPDFRRAVLRRINYFRAMAGVPAEISFSDESNRKAQAAALMMSVNRQLSHNPPTSWKCYSTDGADGAGSSNLYLGVYSWNAITGYMKDPGSGNSAAGHRRWILYPQTQVMGTGDIPNTDNFPASNALRVFDSHMWEQRPPTREEFVAWPPPGFVPYQVVFPRWSFSYANADFSGATVTMQSNGSDLPVNMATVNDGYGENTLVWIPLDLNDGDDWPLPSVDTTYTVNLHGVMLNSQSRDFSYDVIVFNPTP